MRRKNVISLSEKDGTLEKENQNKIELLSCQLESQKCIKHLEQINNSYYNACNYQLDKDYMNSIESLKIAFDKAFELQEKSCLKCAAFFRSTITQSLENLNKDLSKMSTGIFRKKRYLTSYIESKKVLKEFKQKG